MMSTQLDQIITEAFKLPVDGVLYSLSRELSLAYPESYILETEDAQFDVLDFARAGKCTITTAPGGHSEDVWGYDAFSHHEWPTHFNSWNELVWEGVVFTVLSVGLRGAHCRDMHHFVLGPSEKEVRALFDAVCRWNSEVRAEVLVFSGRWNKDRRLYTWMKAASLDTLVLHGDMLEQLKTEFTGFFSSAELYDKYKIAWKRGVLFLGPPGNGKTHAIRGLLNLVDKPILYVKSFKDRYATDHECIYQVFRRARETAPCILVLEDLDSLIDDGNRAYFLNEMDGFASNRGILTVATTNHPGRLDPAILERPSRFDRKYTFSLPNQFIREKYVTVCNDGLEPSLKLRDEEIVLVAEGTDGFSFAYLKELVLSALMTWIREPERSSMARLMLDQVETLRSQMKTPAPAPAPQTEEVKPDFREILTRRGLGR